VRLVLEVEMRPRRTYSLVREHVLVRSAQHSSEVPHLFDEVLFRPALRSVLAANRVVRRMQSGSLRAYLAYLLVTLTVLLAIVRLGVG
jgi:hypothetical protein